MLIAMEAIPHAARALTSAFGRCETASARVLEAALGSGDEDLGSAMVDMIEAKTQVKASVAVVRFADEMYQALLDIGREPRQR